MKTFSDNVDASMQKLKTVLASGLKQFKSSLSKSENAKLSEEIVNTIANDIKEYLVDINNVTID
jgi:Na+/phosphate symporter